MKTEDNEGDRRQFPRYYPEISVDINGRIFPVREQLEEMAEGRDISVSGLCFVSPSSYDVGAHLSMRVRITNTEAGEGQDGLTISRASHPIVTVAEVVRVSEAPGGFEVGVRFVEISGEDYRTLIRHLAKA